MRKKSYLDDLLIILGFKEDDWMLKLIKNILKKYDLDLKVKKSVFTEKPMRPKFLKDHPMY